MAGDYGPIGVTSTRPAAAADASRMVIVVDVIRPTMGFNGVSAAAVTRARVGAVGSTVSSTGDAATPLPG
jgi:hypothetical protein